MKSIFKVANKIQRKLSEERPKRRRRIVDQFSDPKETQEAPQEEAKEETKEEGGVYGDPDYWKSLEALVEMGHYREEHMMRDKFEYNVDQEIKRQVRMKRLEPIPAVWNVKIDDVDTGVWILVYNNDFKQAKEGDIELIGEIPDNVPYEHMGAYVTAVMDKADKMPHLVVGSKDGKEVMFTPTQGGRDQDFKMTYKKTLRNMMGITMDSADLTSVASHRDFKIISLADKFRRKLAQEEEAPPTIREPEDYVPGGMQAEIDAEMEEEAEPSEDFKHPVDGGRYYTVERVSRDEIKEFSQQGYGHRDVLITESDLAHLQSGGALTYSDGEYTTSIELGSEEDFERHGEDWYRVTGRLS